MTLRIGLLGCGRIAGLVHGPVLARTPGARVTALADAVPENRRRLARALPGATHYDDWRLPIELREVDAVVICLPPALHAPAALAAFAAGLHAYVEKPLALTPEDGRAMVEAQAAAGATGMVGLNFRFHPLVEDARARRERGELGEVLAVRALFSSARRPLPGWKGERGAGGDALSDLATHHLDLAGHLAGRPVLPGSLRAEERTGEGGGVVAVTGRLEGGAVLSLLATQATGQGGQWVELLGERGHLLIDLADARPRPLARPAPRLARLARLRERARHVHPAELARRPGAEPSFARALGHFVERASRREPARPDLADGLRALELVEAARASLAAEGPR